MKVFLTKQIKGLVKAVSKEEFRTGLNHIHFKNGWGVATDGFVALLVKMNTSNDEKAKNLKNFTISKSNAEKVLKIMPKNKSIIFGNNIYLKKISPKGTVELGNDSENISITLPNNNSKELNFDAFGKIREIMKGVFNKRKTVQVSVDPRKLRDLLDATIDAQGDKGFRQHVTLFINKKDKLKPVGIKFTTNEEKEGRAILMPVRTED